MAGSETPTQTQATKVVTKGGWSRDGNLYQVETGRRDGRVSRAKEAVKNLPDSMDGIRKLIRRFASKNLSVKDLAVLSGTVTYPVTTVSVPALHRLIALAISTGFVRYTLDSFHFSSYTVLYISIIDRRPRDRQIALPVDRQAAAQLHGAPGQRPDPGRRVRGGAEAAVPEAQGQHDGAGDGAGELHRVRHGLLRPGRGAEGALPLRRGAAQERGDQGARLPLQGRAVGGAVPRGLRGVHAQHGQGGRAHRRPGGDQEEVRLCQLASDAVLYFVPSRLN